MAIKIPIDQADLLMYGDCRSDADDAFVARCTQLGIPAGEQISLKWKILKAVSKGVLSSLTRKLNHRVDPPMETRCEFDRLQVGGTINIKYFYWSLTDADKIKEAIECEWLNNNDDDTVDPDCGKKVIYALISGINVEVHPHV